MSDELEKFSKEHIPKLNQEMLCGINLNTHEVTLKESMTYSVDAGGKRIRPLLFLMTVEMLKGEIDQDSYKVGAAIEMIHTYSLIHDDLPGMDNDELRRGKPTNHIVFGEGMAILAGDALLTEAIHLITTTTYPATLQVRLIHLLTQAAGSGGMIGGQVADIEGEQKALTLSELQSVHERKTGALIEFSVLAGALVAGGTADIIESLEKYSREFGIAFQIKDDLLDVLGDESIIGKKTGMDAQLNKSTYTSLLGIEGAESALVKHCEDGVSAIRYLENKGYQNKASELLIRLLAGLLK